MADRIIDGDMKLVIDALARYDPESDGETARVVLGALAGAERLRSDDLSGVEIQLRAELDECAARWRRCSRPAGVQFWEGGEYALRRLARRLGIDPT